MIKLIVLSNQMLIIYCQIQSSLAPPSADPHGYWHECRLNHAKCTRPQIEFLQGDN